MEHYYPVGDIMPIMHDVLLVQLPALRSLDLGGNYHATAWRLTTTRAPLTYLRVHLPNEETLVKLMSTSPLCNTLRQLHIEMGNDEFNSSSNAFISTLLIEMINLHTFTLVQNFFSILTVEWKNVELLTSSKVMPALRRANVALFVNVNDFSRISSASLFTDHRQVEVNFAFSLINCPRYNEMTQFIPRGACFHPREIAGATFVVNRWCGRSKRLDNDDPYVSDRFIIFLLISCLQMRYLSQRILSFIFDCDLIFKKFSLDRRTSLLPLLSYMVYSSVGVR